MVERLTFEGNFCDIAQCTAMPCPYDNNCDQKKVRERLKAYEDTGLSPFACAVAADVEKMLAAIGWSYGKMRELVRADKEGRLVIMEDKTDG